MNTAEQILVVILSAALAIFIAVGIVALIYTIKLVKTLQIVADKANDFVQSAESVGAMVRQAVGRLSLLRFVHTVMDMVHNKTGKKGDE